jgi:hypothetical protein
MIFDSTLEQPNVREGPKPARFKEKQARGEEDGFE